MDLLSGANSDMLFSATLQQQTQLDALANRALSNGIDLYMNKRYKAAAKEFQRAIGLSTQGDYASDAANYMADAYLKMDKTEKAIDSYELSIRLNPYRDDTNITLGNLYYSLDRFEESKEQYQAAVRKNPSAVNHYSLGQAHLALGQFSEAKKTFNIVKRLAPENANGEYGIGLALAGEGRYEDAINRFEAALRRDPDFTDAYAEIGYAYADMGDIAAAETMVEKLDEKSPDLAETLSKYIYKVDPPKFVTAYSTQFFYTQSSNTPVSSLNAYLSDPNEKASFTMRFVFDKEMDTESVENIYNWKIGRSSRSGPGEAYNFGLPVADTEISPPLYPDHVYYDPTSMMAVVTFSLQQNATADGTIDPSHIEFTFTGEDKFGNKMSPLGDQFSGFSRVV